MGCAQVPVNCTGCGPVQKAPCKVNTPEGHQPAAAAPETSMIGQTNHQPPTHHICPRLQAGPLALSRPLLLAGCARHMGVEGRHVECGLEGHAAWEHAGESMNDGLKQVGSAVHRAACVASKGTLSEIAQR